MEIIWGVFSGLLLLFSLYLSIKGGERGQKATLIAFVVIEILIVLTMFMDWGYSWVKMSALSIAVGRNVWILVPQFMAILVLAVLLGSRLSRSWLAFMLAILQIPLILYSIYMVELDIDVSVFTTASMICLGGSTAAATLLLPTVVRTIPVEGSVLWKLVFSGRAGILSGIKILAQNKGLKYTSPASMFDSGSASGETDKIQWDIQSRPSIWPPAYGISITLINENIREFPQKPALPKLTGCEYTLEAVAKKLRYSCVVRSPKKISRDDFLKIAERLEDVVSVQVNSA